MLEVPWTQTTAAWCLGVLTAVALVLVAIGFVEYETRTLLLNPKVIDTNSFSDYFRVNSLFFDPNIYGRFLAMVMIGVATVLLWTRTQRTAIVCALTLAVLWAGLVLTFSQSSFAALLVGLAILAALRWSPKRTAVVVVLACVLGAGIVVLGQSALHLDLKNGRSLNRARPAASTSSRAAGISSSSAPPPATGRGRSADLPPASTATRASGRSAPRTPIRSPSPPSRGSRACSPTRRCSSPRASCSTAMPAATPCGRTCSPPSGRW